MVEALVNAVRDRPIGKQRGDTLLAGFEQARSPQTLRNDSCCPAKLAVGRSSAVALDRTAVSVSGPYS